MQQLQTSTLSNQDISSYLLAATYTADANRVVLVSALLDQVAGDGNYSIYITRQLAGAGSAYQLGPITVFTVAAAQTAIGFSSGLLPVNNTDVLKVYVKGLAGDTTTPDIITRFYESDTTALLGAPVALDGGAATLAGMLSKLADDNNGATFDATTDSQNKLAVNIADVQTRLGTIAPTTDASDEFTATAGTVISGSYTNTQTDDSGYHILAPVNPGGLDVTYTFYCGTGRAPTSISVNGYWNGSGQVCDVYAYDYRLGIWDKLSNSSTQLASRNNESNYVYGLNREHMDIATNPGYVSVRFVSASTNTAHRLRVDRLLVNTVSDSTGGAGSGGGITAQNVWEYVVRTLTSSSGESATPEVIATAVRTELATELGYLDDDISSRAATGEAATAAATVAATILATPANKLATDVSGYVTYANAAPPTAAAIADAVLDEAVTAHTGHLASIPTNPYTGTPPTADAIGTDAASKILATPANLLATDATGKVTYANTAPPTAADVKTALEADGGKLDHVWEMTEDDGGVRRLTANALEEAPTGGGGGLDAAGVRTALGLASANLDTQLGDLPTNTELATALASADDATLAAIGALNNLSSAQAQSAATAALNAYDPPTNAEMEARTIAAASYSTYAGGAVASVSGNIGGNVSGSVGSVVAPVAATLADKAGFKLASDGLDSIAITAPAGVASNFREMLVMLYRRFFAKTTMTVDQLKTYDDAGTGVLTTQTVSDDGDVQTQGPAV